MARKKSYGGDERSMRNAAQTLLANIRFASVDDPIRTIVVTSTVPNEGKSTISIELARAIAAGGRTALLVECDMRRRSLAAELGVHPQAGLYSVLSGTADLGAVVATVDKNFFFLDVEPHIPNPPDLIASKRFRRFVEGVGERFNYVIFDTPPVAAFVDSAVLSSVVDATVMVVRESFAKRSEVREAYDQLVGAGANVIGVAMNCCHEEKSDYYYAYYDKQGNRVKTSDADSGAEESQQLIPLPTRARHGARPQQVEALSRSELEGALREGTLGDVAVQQDGGVDPALPVNRTRPGKKRTLSEEIRARRGLD